MKRLGCVLIVSIIMIFSGCQQSQQKQGSGVSRKDRLIGNENLELKSELARCRNEIEKQKKLLEQCLQKPDFKNELTECRSEIVKQKKLLEQCQRESALKKELVQCRSEIEKQKNLLEQYRRELDLRDVPALCRSEIEKQKKLLEQYRRELDLKDEPARCRDKIEKQKRLLEQCRQEKEQIEREASGTEKWLMDKLPQNLLEQVEKLTQENEHLKAELARFQVQPPSTPNEMPPLSSPNEPSVN